MDFYKINSTNHLRDFLDIGCDKIGAKIMEKKAKIHMLYIKNMHFGGANILKQDALSIGAELVVPAGAVIGSDKYIDAILIGNTKHFEILSKKELSQPFGLKELAIHLQSYIKPNKFKTKIMGVLNANDDSFFAKSRFSTNDTISKIMTMINDGADIIDIGGVSSRPGSIGISEDEELLRVKDILLTIKEEKLYQKIDFSIDSFSPKVVEYALECGFRIVNDITGLSNPKLAQLASKYNASVVIMHMQGNQTNMQDNPIYEDVVLEIDQFFATRIETALEYGVKDIILDVGIGFGKTLEHNLKLIKHLDTFRHFGYELLLGASRKSMISEIVPSTIEERLSGTLAIHIEGIKNGASIIRCHDVKEHHQALKVLQKIDEI
ncbi:dihydropteroate synthase [Arcobacter sp. FWKO B]|uniref:dihydropteroate synthase n=1 Tax=Arcobacter sp. FWKO B TaxID=2593672 RepID=UPI0018A44AC0|nr:dihydropteroate synthase [Arcobacter sp. FWKO B]QOG11305.1 dihydropteroate synthase [Arcobacter sp. FWKO B]